jgi:sporulation-control protein
MVWQKLLASVGVGNAKVDTVIDHPILKPGGTLTGNVHIKGGDVAQQIEAIELALETIAEREGDDFDTNHKATILSSQLSEALTIQPGEQKAIPFQIKVPIDAPLTRIGKMNLGLPLWLKTSLDISLAIDPSDEDPLAIEPNAAQSRVLAAMDQLGFRLFKADLEFGHIPGSRLPFIQELEFYPGPGFKRHMNEVELTFVGRDNDMDVLFEVDRKTTGLARLMYTSLDEVKAFRVRYDECANLDFVGAIERTLLPR